MSVVNLIFAALCALSFETIAVACLKVLTFVNAADDARYI
jgi:hypothetical protein